MEKAGKNIHKRRVYIANIGLLLSIRVRLSHYFNYVQYLKLHAVSEGCFGCYKRGPNLLTDFVLLIVS